MLFLREERRRPHKLVTLRLTTEEHAAFRLMARRQAKSGEGLLRALLRKELEQQRVEIVSRGSHI